MVDLSKSIFGSLPQPCPQHLLTWLPTYHFNAMCRRAVCTCTCQFNYAPFGSRFLCTCNYFVVCTIQEKAPRSDWTTSFTWLNGSGSIFTFKQSKPRGWGGVETRLGYYYKEYHWSHKNVPKLPKSRKTMLTFFCSTNVLIHGSSSDTFVNAMASTQ